MKDDQMLAAAPDKIGAAVWTPEQRKRKSQAANAALAKTAALSRTAAQDPRPAVQILKKNPNVYRSQRFELSTLFLHLPP
jgi:hypothetical protein